MERPHQLINQLPEERRTSRNCLRIDFVSDGTPLPRCNLRPLDDQARWLVENRPYHLNQHAEFFGMCIEAPTCDACRIYKRATGRQVPFRVSERSAYGWFHIEVPDPIVGWHSIAKAGTMEQIEEWITKRGGSLASGTLNLALLTPAEAWGIEQALS